jgi:hypothetical protein
MRNVCRRLPHAELAHLGEVSNAGRLGAARTKSAIGSLRRIGSRLRVVMADRCGGKALPAICVAVIICWLRCRRNAEMAFLDW